MSITKLIAHSNKAAHGLMQAEKPSKALTHSLSIRTTTETRARLDQISKESGLTPANLIRIAIKSALRNEEQITPR